MSTRQDSHPATVAGRVALAAGALGGALLAGAFGGVAWVRHGRPLHPQGATYAATVTMSGRGASGVAWLDEPRQYDASVRVSRAMGLPLALPDIYGIALRLAPAGAPPVDLLFASTGDSPVRRFMLALRPRVQAGPLTTLLPVRSRRGSLVLRLAAAVSDPVRELSLPARLSLAYAHGAGPWHDVGQIRVGALLDAETERDRHDPLLHELPGTQQYPVIRALRAPAYRAARSVPATPRRTSP